MARPEPKNPKPTFSPMQFLEAKAAVIAALEEIGQARHSDEQYFFTRYGFVVDADPADESDQILLRHLVLWVQNAEKVDSAEYMQVGTFLGVEFKE